MSATYANTNNYGGTRNNGYDMNNGNRNGYDGYNGHRNNGYDGNAYVPRAYDAQPFAPPIARGMPSSLTSSKDTLDTKVTDEDISRQFEEERINKLKDQRAEVQKKVFTRWMNSHLKQKNRPAQVHDLFEDIRDGKALMELMYCLTGEPMHPNPGVLRVQRVENVNRCIEKLEDKLQDKLVNIGAVDIVDSNRIAILGLLWTIILRFQVQTTTETPGEVADYYAEHEAASLIQETIIRPHRYAGQANEGPGFGSSLGMMSGQLGGSIPETVGLGSNLLGSAGKGGRPSLKPLDGGGAGFYPPEKQRELQRIEEAVLMWAKSKCQKYGIDVQNFSTSWRDGQAFCALIHSQCGDEAIDMSQVRPGANKENLDYAFTAAQQLGVDRLLEPDEVDVRNPDSRLILTYVTHLYHNLAKRQGEQIGGRRVAKIVTTLMKIDEKKAHYMNEVLKLRAWLKKTEDWLNDRNFPADTAELQRCLTYFKDRYLADEKPRKMNERDATEAELVVIHTTLAGLNMPRWMPPPDATLRDIGGDWDRLLEAEHNHQTALHSALQQSERLDLMADQFFKRAKIRSDWLDDISARLAAERTPLDDRSAESLLKRYEALSTEIFGVEDRFEVITQIAEKLGEAGYHHAETINAQLVDLLRRRDTLKAEVTRRLEAANLYTVVLGMLQQLRTVAGELSDVQQACQSTNYGQHLLEVAELLERHNNVNTDLKSVGHVLAEIGQHLRQLRDGTAASADVSPTLDAAFRELEDVEKTYELCKGLVESRQQGLLLSQQYHHLVDDCREETTWLREKQMQFDSMEIGRDLTQAQAQARKFEVIQGELSARWARTEKLLSSGGRLTDAPSVFVMSSTGARPPPQPQPTADIKLLCDRLLAEWERVRQRAADRRKLLETSVKLHKLVADMEEASSWLAEKEQVLSNTDCGDDSLSAAALLRRCLQTKEEIASYEDTLKKLIASVSVALTTAAADNTLDAIPVVEKLVALYAYSGRNFDMRKGDVLELVQRTNKDWWLTRRLSDGRQGYVPANYVRLHSPETMDTRLTQLNDRYMRLRAMADLRERNLGEATRFHQFQDSCEQMLAWVGDKRRHIADFAATKLPTPPPAEVGRVSQSSSRSSLPHSISKSVAKEMVDFQKTLSASFASQSGKLAEIKSTADTMTGEKHPQSEQIVALRSRVEAEWADLQQMKLEFEQRAQGMSNLELFEQTVNEALELIDRRLGHWEEQMDRCEDPIRQDFFFQNEINIIQERLAKADRLAKAVAESYPEEAGAVRRRLKQLTDSWAQLEAKKKSWQERIELIHSKRQFEDESHAVMKWLERTTMQLQADATLNSVALPTEERADKVAELETEMRQWISRLDNVVQLGLRAQAAGDSHAEETIQQINSRRFELAELADQFETSVEQQQARERFMREANSVESKLKEYETMLSVVDLGESVDAAEKLYKRIKDDVERKIEILQERVAGLQQLSGELSSTGHPDEAQFASVAANMAAMNKRVSDACAERLKLLADSVKMHQWLADCADFIEWCEEKIRLVPGDALDLSNDPAGIDKRNAKHVAIEAEINRNARKKEDLVALGAHMQEFAECELPGNKQEAVDDAMMRLNAVWDELQSAVARRREVLDAFVNELKLQRTLIASEERLRVVEARLASGQEIGPMAIAENLRSATRAVQRNSQFNSEVNEDIAYLKSTNQLQAQQGRISQSGLTSGISAATNAHIADLLKRYEALKTPSTQLKRKLEIQKAYYELLIELKIELQWIAERMSIVDSSARLGASLWEAQSQMQKFRQVDLDLKGHEQPISRLLTKSQEVLNETDKDPGPINDLVKKVKDNWQDLKEAADKRRKLLEDVLAVQQCVAEVDDLEQWLRDAERAVYGVEDQTDIITVNSAAIDRQFRRQQRLAKELESRSHQLSKLMATVRQLSSNVPMADELPKRLQTISDALLRLHDRVEKAGNKLEASQLYYAWASETSEFSEWIQHNMHLATSQDYGHDSETLKALEDKFDEFFRMIDARSEHYDEISRLSETLINRLKAVGNQHLIEQVNDRRVQFNDTWQGLLGHCARRRSNFAAARVLHQFHQDLDDIQALIAEKRAQISTEMGRDLQSVGRLLRQHDFLFDEVRSVEVQVSKLLKTGEDLQCQFPGPNAENIKERCAETEEKIRQLTLAIEQRGNELDNSEHFFNFMAQSKRAITAADELVRELDALSMFELDLVDQLINEIEVKGQVHLADLVACIDKGRQLIETRVCPYQPEIERRIMELEAMNQRYERTLADKRIETKKALTKRHFEHQLTEISEKAIDLTNKLNRMSCSEFARTSASTSSLIAATAVAGGDPLRAAELHLAEADAQCKVFDQQMDEIVAQVKPMRELDRAVGIASQYVHQARKSLDAKRDELGQATLYRNLAVEANDLENWIESKTALLQRAALELERGARAAETPVSDEIEDRIAQLRRFQSVESEMRHYEPQYRHVLGLAQDVARGIDRTLAQAGNDHSFRVQKGWQDLIDLLSRQTESLNNYRLLLQFIELCQSIEAWIADREMLVLANELGEDYEHCHELYTRVQTEADIAGDVVTNQSEVATKISEINRLSNQLAEKQDIHDYVYDRVLKINERWTKLDQMRSEYLNRLKVALEAHKFVLDCDQLIGQLQSIESSCTTDISGLNQSELELVGRKQNVVERELGIVQNQLERLEGHAEKLAKECPLLAERILARNREVSDLLDRVSNVCNNRHLELDCMLKLYKLFSDIKKLTAFAARTIQEMQEVLRPQSLMDAQSIVEQHTQRKTEVSTRKEEVDKVLQSAELLALERPATEDVARRFTELGRARERLGKIWDEMVEEWRLRKDLFAQHCDYQMFLQLELIADQWIQSKLPLPTDLGGSMSAADALLQEHQKLMKTVEAQSSKIQDLVTHFKTRIREDHFEYNQLLDRIDRITNKYNDLLTAVHARHKLLDDSRRYQRWMTLTGDMLDWISDRLEALDDSPSSGRSALALTDLGGVAARLRHQIGIESEIAANRDLHETLLRRGMVLTGGEAGSSVSARILDSPKMIEEVQRCCNELQHSWGALELALQRRREMLEDAKEISALQGECDRLVRWVTETEGQLSQEDYRMLDDTDAVDMRLRQHEALHGDLEFRRNRLNEMAERADRLCQRGHGLGKDVAAAIGDVDQRVRALDEPMTIHRNNLQDALELCNLRRDIARELVWVGDRAELAASGNLGDSLAHVVTLKKRHERLVQEIEAHGRFIEEIGKRADVLLARQREAASDVRQRFQNLVEALDRLRLAAEDRLKRLEEAMESHRFYAELNDSMNWINAKQRTLADTVNGLTEESIHDVAGQLDLINQETKEYASTIKDVEELATALINRRHFDSSNIDAQRATLLQAYSDLCHTVDRHVEEVRNWRRLFSVRRQLRDSCRQASDWLRAVQSDECGRDLEQCESIMADLTQLIQQIQIGEARMDELCREAGEFEALGDADLLQQLGYLGQLRASVREWTGQREVMLENARSIHAFLREADNTIAWIADKEPGVFSKDLGHDYETVQRLLQKHISVERDLQALSSRMESLHKSAEALSQNFPEAQTRIAVKYTTAANQWSAIVQQWQKRKESLERALALQHFLDEYRSIISWFCDAYKHMTVEQSPRDIEALKVTMLQHEEFKAELASHQEGMDKLLNAGEELLRTPISEEEYRLVHEKMENVKESLRKFVDTWRRRKVEYENRLDILIHSHDLLEVEAWLSKHEAAVKTKETGITVAEVDEHFAALDELKLSLSSIEPRVMALKQYRTLVENAVDRNKEAADRQRLSQLRLNEEERINRDKRRRDERRRTGEVTPAMIAAARQQQQQQLQQQQQQQQQQGQYLQIPQQPPQQQQQPVSVVIQPRSSASELTQPLYHPVPYQQVVQQPVPQPPPVVYQPPPSPQQVAPQPVQLPIPPSPSPQMMVATQPAAIPQPQQAPMEPVPRQSIFSVLSSSFPTPKHVEPVVVIDNTTQGMLPPPQEGDGYRGFFASQPPVYPQQQQPEEHLPPQNHFNNNSYIEYEQQQQQQQLATLPPMSPPPVAPPPPPPTIQADAEFAPSGPVAANAPMYVNIPTQGAPPGKRRPSVTFHETVTEIHPPPSDEELTPGGAQQLVLKPQEKAYTPKAAPPVQHSGFLHRKHVFQPGGRSAPVRSWKKLYVVLSGQLLSFYSSRKDFDALRHCSPPLSLAGAHVELAQDYHKRAYTFRLKLTDRSEYLFSADDNFQLLEWIRRVEFYAAIDPRHQLDSYQPQQPPQQQQKQLPSLLASQQQPQQLVNLLASQQQQQQPPTYAPLQPVEPTQPQQIAVEAPSPQPRQQQQQLSPPQPSPVQREPSPLPQAQPQNVEPAQVSPQKVEQPSPLASRRLPPDMQPFELSPSPELIPLPSPPQRELLQTMQQQISPAMPVVKVAVAPQPEPVAVPIQVPVPPPEPVQQAPPKMSLFMLPPAAPPPTVTASEQTTHDPYARLLEDERRDQQPDFITVDPVLSASLNASLMSFGAGRRQQQQTPTVTATPEKQRVEEQPASVGSTLIETVREPSPKLIETVLGNEIEEYENLDSVPRARRAGSLEATIATAVASSSSQQQPFSPIEENQVRPVENDDPGTMKPLTIELSDQQPPARITTPTVAVEAQPPSLTGSGRRRRPSLEAAAGEDDDSLLGAFDKGTDLLGPSDAVPYSGVPPPAIEPLAASPRGMRARQDDSPQLSPAGFPARQGSLPTSQKQKSRLLDRIGGSFKFNKKK